jgi:hypothetical protein
MPRVELTDRFVGGSKAGDYFDAKTLGLNLRVSPNGIRSWFLVFTSPKDEKRQGDVGAVSANLACSSPRAGPGGAWAP